jgi:hypothetical protein
LPEKLVAMDACVDELLRDHRDLMPPALVSELAKVRARWLAAVPELASLLPPDPTAANNASNGNGARSADSGNERDNDQNGNNLIRVAGGEATQGRRSLAKELLEHPGSVGKAVGERLTRWGRDWAGTAGSGSGSGVPVYRGVRKAMLRGGGPLRY